MMLTKTCDYGIRAAVYIANRSDVEFVSIREIAEQLDISFHFLTKILQKLTQKGMMKSSKGRSGGVMLARPAHTITLLEIILAIEETDCLKKCLLGLENCSDDNPCPIHDQWKVIRENIQSIFETTTLAQLKEGLNQGKTRISNA